MAKKETKSAAAPAAGNGTTTPTAAAPAAGKSAEQKQQEKAAREQLAQGDKFVRVFVDGKPAQPTKKGAKEGEVVAAKLPPQAQVIVNTIEAAGEGGISRKDLVANLKGVLVTRQPEGRILTYYTKLIQDTGCVKVVEASAPAPAAK